MKQKWRYHKALSNVQIPKKPLFALKMTSFGPAGGPQASMQLAQMIPRAIPPRFKKIASFRCSSAKLQPFEVLGSTKALGAFNATKLLCGVLRSYFTSIITQIVPPIPHSIFTFLLYQGSLPLSLFSSPAKCFILRPPPPRDTTTRRHHFQTSSLPPCEGLHPSVFYI